MARFLPSHVFNTFGYRWTMNPGPFRIKEHALIACAYSNSVFVSYALGALNCLELWYQRKIHPFWVSTMRYSYQASTTADQRTGHNVPHYLSLHRIRHCGSTERASSHSATHVLSATAANSCSVQSHAWSQSNCQKRTEVFLDSRSGDLCLDMDSTVYHATACLPTDHLLDGPWQPGGLRSRFWNVRLWSPHALTRLQLHRRNVSLPLSRVEQPRIG